MDCTVEGATACWGWVQGQSQPAVATCAEVVVDSVLDSKPSLPQMMPTSGTATCPQLPSRVWHGLDGLACGCVSPVALAAALVLRCPCRFNLRESATGPIIGDGVITGTFYSALPAGMPTTFLANEILSIQVNR
jgi:hypothetical protein